MAYIKDSSIVEDSTTKEQLDSSSSSSHSHHESQDEAPGEKEEEAFFLSGLKLNTMVFSLCISILLVALDNAILATAVPTITAQFDSIEDVGWYGSAFLIAVCACQPIGGKVFQYFSLKWAFIGFLVIFELGSLICAVAPNSDALIVGRAIAGMGASGIFSGGLVIVTFCIRPRLRPVYMSVIMTMFAVANIVGPVLGGAFTQHVSWRWCFYINLPLGALSAAILFFVFHPPTRKSTEVPLKEKIDNLDLPGFAIFAPGIVMLLLAITWGGTKYAWSSATVIGLLCASGVTLVGFGFWEWHQQDKASIPPRVLRYSTLWISMAQGALLFGSLNAILYFVPIWFQAIKDVSPTQSGVNMFPIVLGNVVLSLVAGALATKFGYYNHFLFMGAAFIAIGSGLYSTWQPDTPSAKWIGYQVLTGAGFGAVFQFPMATIQATLPMELIAMGTSVLAFCQFLGGAVFLAIASNVFRTELVGNLNNAGLSNYTKEVLRAGAQSVRGVVSEQDISAVLQAYNDAIVVNFYLPVAGGALIFLLTFGLPWINVKGKNKAVKESV